MGKKRRASSADPTRAAMGLYERSLGALDGGDEAAALALLDGAARALALAPGGDVASGLGAEVELARGRLLEASDAPAAAAAYEASHGADGNAAAAVLAARLAWLEDAPDVEKLLRRGLAAAAGDGDARRDAAELLCRFLLERGDGPGAAALLVDLGYAATFSPRALAGRLPTRPAAREAGAPRVWDGLLPPAALAALRSSFADGAAYYAENDYGSPSVGFFSFRVALPTSLGVVRHVHEAVAAEFPEVEKATHAEFWAHRRRHGHGHELHYDSVPGLRPGDAPRHPLVSTVLCVDGAAGGPTLVTDQTFGSAASRCWAAAPRANRLLAFDGRALHGVLPGAGSAPGRRVTFMVNFWACDPTGGKQKYSTRLQYSSIRTVLHTFFIIYKGLTERKRSVQKSAETTSM